MQDSIVYLNGLFTSLENAKVSILDRGFCYGDGLFETMRGCNKNIFRLDSHIDRLFQSLPLIFMDLPMTRKELGDVVQETLARNNFKDAIVRLTVTRGMGGSSFQIDSKVPPTLVIHVKPHISLPKSIYKKGIHISLCNAPASGLPGVKRGLKSCNFLSNIMIKEISVRNGFMEGIIVDPVLGVTEGATSNLFIVKHGVLKTPAINNAILAGITRKSILDIARDHKIPVEECKLISDDVFNADEVFISNSGIDIVPVIRVDGTSIGTKKPGIMTQFLHEEYLKGIEGTTET